MTTKTKKAAPAAAKSQALNESDQAVVEKLAASTNGNGQKPEPVPGDKNFDWQAEYPDEKVFVYTVPKGQTTARGEPLGGLTIGLAAIGEKRQPDVGFLMDVRMKPEFDQVLDMILIVAGPAALSLIRRFKPTDLQTMFEEWSEWSKSTAGE